MQHNPETMFIEKNTPCRSEFIRDQAPWPVLREQVRAYTQLHYYGVTPVYFMSQNREVITYLPAIASLFITNKGPQK